MSRDPRGERSLQETQCGGICNFPEESRRTWYGRSGRGAYLEAGRAKKGAEERGEARRKKRAGARKRAGRRRRMWWRAQHEDAVDHMTAAAAAAAEEHWI
jgi:hypothetical protein